MIKQEEEAVKELFTKGILTLADMVNIPKHELPLTFIEYQDAAKNTAIYRSSINEYVATLEIKDKVKEQDLVNLLCKAYTILGLAGEAGELAGKMSKILRDDKGVLSEEKIKDMNKENGDILWFQAQTATEFGASTDSIAKTNIDKLLRRKENGTIQGSGDSR